MQTGSHGRIMPHILRLRPLDLRVHEHDLQVGFFAMHAEKVGKRDECLQPEVVLFFQEPQTESDLIDGIAGADQGLHLCARDPRVLSPR